MPRPVAAAIVAAAFAAAALISQAFGAPTQQAGDPLTPMAHAPIVLVPDVADEPGAPTRTMRPSRTPDVTETPTATMPTAEMVVPTSTPTATATSTTTSEPE